MNYSKAISRYVNHTLVNTGDIAKLLVILAPTIVDKETHIIHCNVSHGVIHSTNVYNVNTL